MIIPTEPVYSKSLPGGLTLRTATAADVDRLAAFNGLIHGGDTVEMTRRLLLEHPHVTGRDFIFVEDGSGRVLSSLCVIPWTWSYAGASLSVGETGIVGTLEECRGRGLIRAQVEFFRQRLAERGCLLSIIQGIPFFYRQFGYEYALPLEAAVILELRQAPAPPGASAAAVPGPEPAAGARPQPLFTFRRATGDDIPVLAPLYEEAVAGVTIHALRGEATWRYLLHPYTVPDCMSHQTWLVESAAGLPCGYFRVAEYHFHAELTMDEASALPYDAAIAALAFLKELALQREEPGIRLNLPSDHNLVRLALAFGGHDRGAYCWQLMIPDIPALLRGLAPALERRLAASMFAGLTRELRIGFYRMGFTMRFENGKLVAVTEMRPVAGSGDANMPVSAFTPLVFGWRSLEQLHREYPDLGARGATRVLLDTLFPPCSAFIHTVY